MELTFLCVITNVDDHVRSMLTHRGGGPMGRLSKSGDEQLILYAHLMVVELPPLSIVVADPLADI